MVRNLPQEDFGMTVTKCAKLRRDFSAAFQAAKKMGVGKMRYIEIAYVVTQDLVKTKKVIIGKIEGTENATDIFAKYLKTGKEVTRSGESRTGGPREERLGRW